jgi:hypothetical protein
MYLHLLIYMGKAGGVAQLVELLPGRCEALSSNSNIAKNKQNGKLSYDNS